MSAIPALRPIHAGNDSQQIQRVHSLQIFRLDGGCELEHI